VSDVRPDRHGLDETADLDALWDFDDPAACEARFRERARTPGARGLAAATQVARALGLQERFPEARRVLDGVDADPAGDAEVETRAALERGRLDRSAGDPVAARPHFETAAALAREAGLERLHVDALHMLALDLPPGESIRAHLQALEIARASRTEGGRGWEASLLNNLGMAYHDLGDLPSALATFEEALVVCRREGDAVMVRAARWMVGWSLRLLGRAGEALAVQRELQAELVAAGEEPDPYVEGELGQLTGGAG
jgi:tetratricopeptide (TPR) repeat protein